MASDTPAGRTAASHDGHAPSEPITDRTNMRALLAVADALGKLPEVERIDMDLKREWKESQVVAELSECRRIVFLIDADWPNLLVISWRSSPYADFVGWWPENYYDLTGLDDARIGRIAMEETYAFQRTDHDDRDRLWSALMEIVRSSHIPSMPGPVPADWHGRFAAWRLHADKEQSC